MLNPYQKVKLSTGGFSKSDKPIRPIVRLYEALVGGRTKPSGRAVNVCCPIHGEEHPSCALYPDTNSFYCFSCGAKGDYISFVMQVMKVDFKEALSIIEKL